MAGLSWAFSTRSRLAVAELLLCVNNNNMRANLIPPELLTLGPQGLRVCDSEGKGLNAP